MCFSAACKVLRLEVFFSSAVPGSCFFNRSKHSFRWARLCFSNLLWTSLIPDRNTMGGCLRFCSPVTLSLTNGLIMSKLLWMTRCGWDCGCGCGRDRGADGRGCGTASVRTSERKLENSRCDQFIFLLRSTPNIWPFVW